MTNLSEVLDRLDHERRCLMRDEEIIEVLPSLTRLRTRDNLNHCVIYSSLTDDTADAAISQEIEHHRRLGVGFEWKHFSHDDPEDMIDRLERHGFQIGATEAVLVLDLAQGQEWIAATNVDNVRRIDRMAQIPDFQRVSEDAFGRDCDVIVRQLTEAVRLGSTQHRGYIACVGDEPASIGRLYTHPDSYFGGLYGGGTRPKFRRQGAYRSVVAARAQDAMLQGARYLLVDALPQSRAILERLGFELLTDTWPCEWRP